MKIATTYSHKQAEALLDRQFPGFLDQVREAIAAVDAGAAKTKVKPGDPGKFFYDRRLLGELFDSAMAQRGWYSARCNYYLTLDKVLIRKIATLPAAEQKEILIRHGEKNPLFRYAEIDYKKEGVTAEVQLGNHLQAATDLYMKHALFFTAGMSVAGIEILPVRRMQQEISSTATFFEAEAYLLMRTGEETPAVPLLLLGVEP